MRSIVLSECRLEKETPRGNGALVTYVIDMHEYPFPIRQAAEDIDANIVSVPVADWDDSLTPWVAPGLYKGDADFGGHADTTLRELVDEVIPTVEKRYGIIPKSRAICGYSLGGLFSLYAFLHSDAFGACAALSPSVWYPGWLEHVAANVRPLEGHFAFLSIGKKEKRAMPAILHCVEDHVRETANLLSQAGCMTKVEIGPGNHMQRIPERLKAGLTAVDIWNSQQ